MFFVVWYTIFSYKTIHTRHWRVDMDPTQQVKRLLREIDALRERLRVTSVAVEMYRSYSLERRPYMVGTEVEISETGRFSCTLADFQGIDF